MQLRLVVCFSVVVISLGRGADLHMAQLMPLPLTISCSSKSRLVLPFWAVMDKVPLTGVVVVVVQFFSFCAVLHMDQVSQTKIFDGKQTFYRQDALSVNQSTMFQTLKGKQVVT